MQGIKEKIRAIPDYPKPGIMFRDITTLLQDARGFRKTVDEMVQPLAGTRIDKVVGIEARGFILGGAIAHQLSIGFVPVRKRGKLPWKTLSQEYQLEYGTDSMEIHIDAIQPNENILIVDDLIATGGTAEAAIKLIRAHKGNVVGCSFIVDLPELGGRKKLEALGVQVLSLCEFDGH
ncbi:MAG: adenine phosphoribosyltransferase [Ferrovibrio sp.]|jgi:adenine phosphoribosyltransferase|uniref:Adenine phosphoribosyltransferase n=1 Tax=Ferrovibrio terrae TaxID=2594003 RepID=A0A516H2Y4_9PROT|nr:adenine phosphoribosyltransferase [Ferrovibrio terrae]MBS4046326.1 adenine phosphoribosyltransferase [Alphaproteobacteria bacterium]QDO98105.1 adenine phosphoribosyltransferase [Ferrovibrio terrae]